MFLYSVPFLLVSLQFFASSAHSQSVNFTDCGESNVQDLRISPCAGTDPCILKLGTNVSVEADFIAPFSTHKLYEVIKGVIRGKEMPFPEQRSDPCQSGVVTPGCPIVKGQKYKFRTWFEIKPFYPAISIKVKYTLADPAGKKLVCVQVAAKIVDPDAKNGSKKKSNRSRKTSSSKTKKH